MDVLSELLKAVDPACGGIILVLVVGIVALWKEGISKTQRIAQLNDRNLQLVKEMISIQDQFIDRMERR